MLEKNRLSKTINIDNSFADSLTTHWRSISALTCVVLALTGCTQTRSMATSPTTTGAMIGAVGGAAVASVTGIGIPGGILVGGITGAAFAQFLKQNATLLQSIQAAGVQIIQVGDQLSLVLPAERFFIANSQRIQPDAIQTLDLIVQLLRDCPKITVHVTGYTDNQNSPERNLALSQAWADETAKYLWERDIDVRLLLATGKGECGSVANNATAAGRAANRRVEITLTQEVEQRL